ncbi:hypothetical protein DFQ05_1414 [Winogradskyella wandonensis]|uniref:Uncharacterized protein n=1 Tax=Winogradskyella wandonensis TaxID=1442586 RepID=A0A4R1KRH0_9FLAO|nr:hypothetical protein DFQ05_1414 [Winogradskyella wandonensis]
MDKLDTYISYFLLGLSFILFATTYLANKKSKYYNRFLVFLLTMISIELASSYYYRQGNNLFLSHIYFFVRFLTLSFFYRALLYEFQKRIVDIVFVIVSVIFVFYHVGGYMDYYHVSAFNPFEVFVCSVPICIYSVLHVYNSLENKMVFAYINYGLLIYITVSTLLFITGFVLNNNENVSKKLALFMWNLNSVFWIICLLLFIVEWWKNYRPKKIV